MSRKQWSAAALIAWVLASVGVVGSAVGCDNRQTASRSAGGSESASNTAATHPTESAQSASATQPAGRPADTQPTKSFLTIDARVVEFPAARLRLRKTDEGVRALLFSNDPKEAISSKYRGNSFYFDMPLKIADPSDLDDAEYSYKAPTSETEEDSPNGIFLDGMRVHLQPQDVALKFEGDPARPVARLAGRFLVVNTTGDAAPGQFVGVSGTLFMAAEVKGD